MNVILENGNPTPLSGPDRWTPKLDGEIYCSPACGGGCKKADYDLAVESANSLVAKLGVGWQPHVWENLGWHYEAKKRGATVCADEDGLYTADIRFSMTDRTELCISATRSSPGDAVRAVVEELNDRIAALRRALVSLSNDALLEIQDASTAHDFSS